MSPSLMLDETRGAGADDESNPNSSPVVDGFDHTPVLLRQVVDAYAGVPPGVVLDCTLGGGGHSDAILSAHDHLSIVGIDRDETALSAASARLSRHGDRASLHRARFDQLGDVLDELELDRLSGFLFDLGVSSPQLDVADRGFSFRHDGPLDMRMDQSDSQTASDIINGYDHGELASVLRRFGDERFSGRIASAIISQRPITSTVHLAEIVVSAIPAATRRKGGHPAKRTFQALRIEVNSELSILRPSIDSAITRLLVEGIGVVLTYHSGEDRIAKDVLRTRSAVNIPPGLPVPAVDPEFTVLRPIRPGDTEMELNRRARSGRMRTIRRNLEAA